MEKGSYIHNLVAMIIFGAIVITLSGGAKAWAIVPLFFLLVPSKGEKE